MQTKTKQVEYRNYIDPMTNSPMWQFKLDGCVATVAINELEKWATVYFIETIPSMRNKGLATELMKYLKINLEGKGYRFGGTVALNPAMKRVYEKSGVTEYADED